MLILAEAPFEEDDGVFPLSNFRFDYRVPTRIYADEFISTLDTLECRFFFDDAD